MAFLRPVSHRECLNRWRQDVSALSSQGLPGYTRVDVRLAWQATPRCELSLVGQNLMNGCHREFSGPAGAAASAPVSRNVYRKVTWRF